MLTPASANAYAGGTAPGILPGMLPAEEQSQALPAGPGTEPDFEPSPAVIIGLSAEARGQLDRRFGPEPEDDDGILPEEVKDAAEGPLHPTEEGDESSTELTPEEQQITQKMAARDAEVRAHENAHVAAAGGLAGGPTFTYQTGPDGKRYAIGGSVKIDISKGSTPEETLSKAERIRAAALAPSEPSSQDVSVASKASQMASEARSQIAQEKRMEAQQALEESTKNTSSPWAEAAGKPDSIPEPGSLVGTVA